MSFVPRVTFGIIVLNGEPFLQYNLRALYPFAHQIVVVEGATRAAAEAATTDGHSTDGTLESLYRFKREEDKEEKLEIIVRDGFWDEKHEQSQAYAKNATGNYLWQVDIDEFYHPEDMKNILEMLSGEVNISGVSFYWKNFWGGFDYLADGWPYRDAVNRIDGMRRIFQWKKGYQYVNHRPPTVIDDESRNLCDFNWIHPQSMARRGIFIYHYGMIFPKQAREKTLYYKNMWKSHENMEVWRSETFENLRRRFRIIHGLGAPTWLTRFYGHHPPEILKLQQDLKSRIVSVDVRKTDDLEKLLRNIPYRIVVNVLEIIYPMISALKLIKKAVLWPFGKARVLIQKITTPPIETLPHSPDIFRDYRSLAQHPDLKRAEGGWYYLGHFYPDYLTVGGACHAIFPIAQKHCRGSGVDIGAGFWPLPDAIPVDLFRGTGLGRNINEFPDSSLDYVFSSHCLEHVEQWRNELMLWIRKIRPGGTIFLYLPHPQCEIWRPGSPFVGDGHKWSPSPEIVKVALKEFGCNVIEYEDEPDAMYSFYVCAIKN